MDFSIKTADKKNSLDMIDTDCIVIGIYDDHRLTDAAIALDTGGAITRKVSILQHRGETGGHRRFEYGKDLTSISRTEHWGAITACYGYGKGLETDSGGYGRKLTFGDVNGGKDYVEDATALKTYGRPDGKGGFDIYQAMPLAHTIEHRVSDGTPAGSFRADICYHLEHFTELLA